MTWSAFLVYLMSFFFVAPHGPSRDQHAPPDRSSLARTNDSHSQDQYPPHVDVLDISNGF